MTLFHRLASRSDGMAMAPMIDFSGEDIPMQTSSCISWIHPEATMDSDSNFNPGSVKIDAENHHPETFKYEMMDDPSAK